MGQDVGYCAEIAAILFVLCRILLLTTWSKVIMEQKSSNVKGGVKIMASSKEYLHFILEQLSDLDDISYQSMMEEYIIYYRGKIVGGIYKDKIKHRTGYFT